jgi:hypothetical protein
MFLLLSTLDWIALFFNTRVVETLLSQEERDRGCLMLHDQQNLSRNTGGRYWINCDDLENTHLIN